MPLSDVKFLSVKGCDRLSKLSDGQGLQLWVSPAGGRSRKLAYRLNSQQKLVTFGSYPEMSLQQAREKRDEAKRQIADGIDPAQQKKMDRITKAANDSVTFSLAKPLVQRLRRAADLG